MALSKGSKRFLIFLAVFAVLAGGAVVVGLQWLEDQTSGSDGPREPVEIEVAAGSSAASVASQLVDAGVVGNAFLFRRALEDEGIASRIVAGTYQFETGMGIDAAVDVLAAGPGTALAGESFRVTIPEGLTVAQTLERLEENSPHSAAEYQAVLDEERADPAAGPLEVPDWVPAFDEFGADIEVFEGLLFPETYEFRADATPEQVLQRMLDQVDQVMQGIPEEQVTGLEADAGLTRYDALILSSLVEREAKVDDERPLIARVLRNRVAENMLLQIDATLLYAAGDPAGGPGSIDTEIDSPYNTYQNPGLPPTPISGARSAALQAVFDPAEGDYRYYVVSPACDGSHNFAETLEEHNANVAAYRDAGRCES